MMIILKYKGVVMQTIQINNPEIESIIISEYGNDTKTLMSDFVEFIKAKATFLKTKREFNKTLEDVNSGKEPLYDEAQYTERMNTFKNNLENNQNH